MYVYLIHFDQPISADHTCQHYIGYAKHSMKKRLAEHKAGKQVANERGISYRIVRWWKGGRALERELKNKKCSPKLCPICSVVKGKNQ